MTLRLRPRLRALETRHEWASTRLADDFGVAVYRDLLRCSRDNRESAVRYLMSCGLAEEEARRIRPALLGDYGRTARRLLSRHGYRRLAKAGVLSRRGNLVFYRHRLLLPLKHKGALVGVAGKGFHARLRPDVLLPRGLALPEETLQALEKLLQRMEAEPPATQLSLL